MPKIVITSTEQFQAALEVIEAFEDAPPGSAEAHLRYALQLAVREWRAARDRLH